MTAQATTETSKHEEIVKALSNFDKPAIKQYLRKNPPPSLEHIPGGKGLPFFGHIFPVIKDLRGWLDKQYADHGPVFKLCTPIGDSLFLIGPEANKLVFQNEGKKFCNYPAYEPAGRD